MIPYFENSSFSGVETITLKPFVDTSEILFHVQNISINEHSISIKSTGSVSKQIDITNKYSLDGSKYLIKVSETLKRDEEYNLDLSFSGHLNTQLKGFYQAYYRNGGSER